MGWKIVDWRWNRGRGTTTTGLQYIPYTLVALLETEPVPNPKRGSHSFSAFLYLDHLSQTFTPNNCYRMGKPDRNQPKITFYQAKKQQDNTTRHRIRFRLHPQMLE